MHKKKLSFVGVGPQKTATTWVYNILKSYYNVCFPSLVKETFFWDYRFNNGIEWYFSHFDNSDGKKMGEIGPTYFHQKKSADRLFSHNPKIKIIVTLREPVSRSYSLYLHQKMRGRCKDDFWKATKKFPEIIQASHYAIFLKDWLKIFGPDNLLIILNDDIFNIPGQTIKKISDFLNIQQKKEIVYPYRKVNIASQSRNYFLALISTKIADMLRRKKIYAPINAAKKIRLKQFIYSSNKINPRLATADKEKLRKIFKKDVQYIREITGRKLAKWSNI